MKRIFFAILLAFFAIAPASAANFYWKASTTDLNAISAPSSGDRAIVITDAGAVSYWTYSGSAWVQGSCGLSDLDDLPGDTVDDNLIDVGLIADLGPMIHGKTGKTTPADADELPLSDSEATNALKKLTWANLKVTLKTYFDGIYSTFNPAEPGAIGGTTPAAGTFTTVTATSYQSSAADNEHFGSVENSTSHHTTPAPATGDFDSVAGIMYIYRSSAWNQIWDDLSAPRPVSGPSSNPTDGALAAFDGTTGRLVKQGPAIGTTSGTIAAGDHTHSGYLATGGDLDSLESGITGIVKGAGNGGGYSAAQAGTDYQAPLSAASASDINTGTDTAKYLTADALAGSDLGAQHVCWIIVKSDTVTAVADGKDAFVVPAAMSGMNLTDLTCSVSDLNSASGGSTDVVVRRVRGATAVDMTSTACTISYNAYTASDETVDTSNDDLQTGDKIFVDVNAVTTGAVQKGLSCTATFAKP